MNPSYVVDQGLVYTPRQAFVPFHNRRQRFAILTCHRRSGKTVAITNDLLIGALEEERQRPQLAYIAPTYAQAKRIAWEYLKDYVRPFLKEPPNESELRVDLKNNGRIFLAGSDNPDSLRGLYLDGAVIDEAASSHPSVWTQIIRPALADRNGWAVLASTPKGKNHFYDMWLSAEANPEWYRLLIRADESQIIPAKELLLLRQEMPTDEFEQEMLCSFTATSKGAILFREIEEAAATGRIVDYEIHDPTSEVYVAADLGFRDTAAFWFAQKTPTGIQCIDYMEDAGLDADDWIERLKNAQFPPDEVWLPHDARARTFTTRNSALETFLRAGIQVRVVPRTTVLDRINAARVVARHTTFNGVRCRSGLSSLREWTFEWNADTKSYSRTPMHNWASHGADAFSYLSQMIGNHVHGMKVEEEKKEEAKKQEAQGAHFAFTLDEMFNERSSLGIRRRGW